MSENYAALITRLKLFQGYTTDGAQRLLASGAVKQHAAQETLFNEGDPPAFVLLVLAGKLEVFVQRKGRDIVLNHGEPGTILGELADDALGVSRVLRHLCLKCGLDVRERGL